MTGDDAAAADRRRTRRYRTGLGTSDLDSITLLGHDLADDLIGKITFGELAFWLMAKRRPTAGQRTMFEAVLVALADHGFTPTAIAARLTLLSAPDSVQGALAAGLLGGGSRFLGVTENAARFLHDAIAASTCSRPTTPVGTTSPASSSTRHRRRGSLRPRARSPRAQACGPAHAGAVPLARRQRLLGPHLALFAAIGRTHAEVLGRRLPLNGAGVCGAVLADLDLPLGVVRGVALLARCAGLLGHLAEEMTDPVANDVYLHVDRNIDYRPPPRS